VQLTRAEQVLADGSDDELSEQIDADAFAIIDWRAEFDEIVEEFARFLPNGYVTLEEATDGKSLRLWTTYATATVPLNDEPPFGLDVAAAIASILPPEFEARALADTLGDDTQYYFVRPAAWWDGFRRAYPQRYRRLFAEPSMLPSRFEIIADGPGPNGWWYLGCGTLALSAVVIALLALAAR
jgi:hypothetical protein